MPSPTAEQRVCPSCGAVAPGKFCSECGAAVGGAVCLACRSELVPGARFCHRCGTAVGGVAGARQPSAGVGNSNAAPLGVAPGAPSGGTGGADTRPAGRSSLPWAVTAVALLALVALVAGQRFGASRLAANEGQFAGGGATPFGAPPGAVRAPDISSLSPRERADRLFDRVMRLSAEGKSDSVQFFAPMALSVYQSMGELDADLRYDYGRIAEAAGAAEIARAQADSILRTDSSHLLGLVLASRAAQMRGDSATARDFRRRLLAAEPAESSKDLPEYQRHRADILEALAEARRQ